jgi:hypothetical protein
MIPKVADFSGNITPEIKGRPRFKIQFDRIAFRVPAATIMNR